MSSRSPPPETIRSTTSKRPTVFDGWIDILIEFHETEVHNMNSLSITGQITQVKELTKEFMLHRQDNQNVICVNGHIDW